MGCADYDKDIPIKSSVIRVFLSECLIIINTYYIKKWQILKSYEWKYEDNNIKIVVILSFCIQRVVILSSLRFWSKIPLNYYINV